MALRVTDAHLAVITAGTAHTFTRISIGQGHRTPDGTETALVTPFVPAREHTNPPGVVDANTRAVDWIDGATGDAVTYTASEAGLWATPAGGAEYLAFYDSHATDDLFTKPEGSIISHRFLILATATQMVNATFNVSAVPAATETVAGVIRIATDTEADAAENAASDNVAVTPAKWWRMFGNSGVGEAIANALSMLTGNARLSYNSLRNLPNLSLYALVSTLANYATLASPTFSGTPRAPSPAGGDDSTRIATTAQVQNAIDRRSTNVESLTDAATISWNWNDGFIAEVTLGGNRTLGEPVNGIDNALYLLRVTQDATGGRTLTLDGDIDRGDIPVPSLSTGNGDTDVLGFMRWGGTVHYIGILKGY